MKRFSPLRKWFISTFIEALLTLSYSGPRVFPREAGPSPKERARPSRRGAVILCRLHPEPGEHRARGKAAVHKAGPGH